MILINLALSQKEEFFVVVNTSYFITPHLLMCVLFFVEVQGMKIIELLHRGNKCAFTTNVKIPL